MIGLVIISNILLLIMVKWKNKHQIPLTMFFGIINGVISKIFLLSKGINL